MANGHNDWLVLAARLENAAVATQDIYNRANKMLATGTEGVEWQISVECRGKKTYLQDITK